MPLFVIISPPNNPQHDAFQAALDRVFPNSYERIDQGQYVASRRDVTSQQAAELLGLDGTIGQFAVFNVGGYGGWHQNALWEWMRVRGAS